MNRETFNEISSLNIICKKSVFVRSWENNEIEVRYPENKECQIGIDHGHMEINAKSYCIISMPGHVKLSIERVYGNFEFAGQLATIDIDNISGNCSIQSVESLSIQNVSGNCKIGSTGTQSKIRNVGGNFHFIVDNGSINVNGVGGNLSGKAESICLSTTVGGNLKLVINKFEGEGNHLRAGGSIKLNISDLDNSTIDAKAGGIASYVYKDESEKFQNGKFEKKLGNAERIIQLRAGGNIKISDQEAEFEINQTFSSVDEDYVDQMEQKFEARGRQSTGFDFSDFFDFDGEIGEKIREKTQMADEKIQRAMEKMERKFSFKEEFGDIPRPPRPVSPFETKLKTPKSAPISNEEKMMILRMLQENKINAEEADRLLNALEQN
jgi:hypothetical protein